MHELSEAARAIVRYCGSTLESDTVEPPVIPARLLQRLQSALMIYDARQPSRDEGPWRLRVEAIAGVAE